MTRNISIVCRNNSLDNGCIFGMIHPMRRGSETKRDHCYVMGCDNKHLKLPLHVIMEGSCIAEATFFAQAWKKAKTAKRRESIITGLMHNAALWDVVTRSTLYYDTFEEVTGKKFPGFWQ